MDDLKKAGGGNVNTPPWYVRNEARNIAQTGGLKSSVAGRTDQIPLNVKSGAYVVPADVVSGLGKGNSQAGMAVLDRMMKTGPYGVHMPRPSARRAIPKPPPAPKFANGGAVPIMAAGGEYLIDPEHVAHLGNGDVDMGHRILDQFVKQIRADTIGEMSKLPGPERG